MYFTSKIVTINRLLKRRHPCLQFRTYSCVYLITKECHRFMVSQINVTEFNGSIIKITKHERKFHYLERSQVLAMLLQSVSLSVHPSTYFVHGFSASYPGYNTEPWGKTYIKTFHLWTNVLKFLTHIVQLWAFLLIHIYNEKKIFWWVLCDQCVH